MDREAEPRNTPEKHHLLGSSLLIEAEADRARDHKVPTSVVNVQSLSRPDKQDAQWIPFALRWYFLIIPTGVSIILAVLVMVLYWQSEKHNGLGSERSAMVGWKFAPTLIAVAYTQLAAMVLGALKRTEPFARLAKPVQYVPVARYTLLEKSKPWWTTFVHGFQKRRNPGCWSWTIIISSIAFLLAVLGISPMSAALLTTRNVQISNQAEFNRLVLNGASALRPQTERSTYLRATGALLQNYSTSPWVTDEYFILPFTPKELPNAKWNFETLNPQTWEAETTVFHNNLVCSALETKEKEIYLRHMVNVNEAEFYDQTFLASVLLESTDGCRLNLTYNITSNPDINSLEYRRYETFASWTDIKQVASRNEFDQDARISLNDECHMDELILMSTPWMTRKVKDTLHPNMTLNAYACRSEHTMATMPVHASSSSTGLSLDFDREQYQRIRETVPATVLNVSSLHDVYSSPEWYEYIPQPSLVGDYITGDSSPILHGAAALLGTKYNFNISTMMADPDLPQQAARMRRRFFAEILRTSLDNQQEPQQEVYFGTRVQSERRILVNRQIAVTLCVLLSVSFCCFTALLWFSRRKNRPLHLQRDPSSVLGLCSIITPKTDVLDLFKSLDLAPRAALKAHLATRTFATSPKALYEVSATKETDLKASSPKSSGSTVSILPALRIRNLLGLLTYVLALLIATAVLFKFAKTSSLRQGLFTYRANIQFFGDNATFSPFAIIPTLLAVGITLWWDSIDSACRMLQPYLAMSHRTERPSHGIALSYASSFWIWASLKAARNRHWLLSLFTLTTFLMQALTVAMSALFQESSVSMPQTHTLDRSLEVRRDPLVTATYLTYSRDTTDAMFYAGNPAEEVGMMLAGAFGGLETNWLYTAILQASLQGPEPAWSKEGWSFVPLDLSNLTRRIISTSSANDEERIFSDLITATNLTVQTSALRGRVNCSVVEELQPEAWLTTQNGTRNLTSYDQIYYPTIDLNIGHSTTQLTPMAAIPECCFNTTDSRKSSQSLDMDVTLAYWTENLDNATTGGFITKWIRGPAGFRDVDHFPLNPRMVFAQPPAIQALSCVPHFETADAEVTVDQSSGVVHRFTILGEPISDAVAWSDNFALRRTNESYTFHNSTEQRRFNLNITTSYGALFMKSLLHAACLENLNYNEDSYYRRPRSDYLSDKIFNMRDNSTGLNVDFMSYAALAQVGHDPAALLDPAVLLRETQKVFSIFFQHYVSSTVSLESGGWAYQPIGSDLQVPEPIPNESLGRPATKFEDFPLRNTARTVTATLHTQVEVLQMNPVAFWVSISIMLWLIATILVFAAMQRHYLGGMQRNIECIADVLVLIAGSERLLGIVEEKGIDTILKEDKILTQLGWFRDPDGTMRWRIELVEEQEEPRPISLGMAYAPVSTESDERVGYAASS